MIYPWWDISWQEILTTDDLYQFAESKIFPVLLKNTLIFLGICIVVTGIVAVVYYIF